MMQLSELSDPALLRALAEKGIRVHARDGRLGINGPSGAVDPGLRAELSRRKDSLLQLLHARQARPKRTIPHRDTHKSFERIPQTPAQQGMWLQDHFSTGSVAYNIPQAFLIPTLDLPRLQQAVDALLAHHEVLRTSFYQADGKLFQRISADARSVVGFTDLSVLPGEERKPRATELLQQHARSAFDLGLAPLIRFHVFRLGEPGDVLFVNIHHIIADRRSIGILREDLLALYSGQLDSLQTQQNEDSVQFADYALWAAEELQSPGLLRQQEYWKGKLAEVPPYLSLPHSKPLPEQRSSSGAMLPLQVGASTVGALTKTGQELGATPFMVFLGVFAVLLAQVSGEEDFCVGTPMTHRKQVDLERTIGLFVNMVALRCTLRPEMHFVDVLEQIRTTALEAFENSDVPFQSLLRILRPDRRTGRSPVFQVLFIFDSYVPTIGQAEQANIEVGTARYDLTLHLAELEDGSIAGMFEYCTDMFAETDITALAEAFYNLLPQLAAMPREPLNSLLQPSPVQIAAVDTRDFAMQQNEAASPKTDVIHKQQEMSMVTTTKHGLWKRIFGAG
jgi:hypothetical protein